MTPEVCPNCGAEVPARAKACPECGADERTGWSDEAHHESIGLPDDSFDYDEYVKREFAGKRQRGVPGIRLVWQVIAAILVAGLLYLLWRGWF
jgi:hypothetical protein